VLKILLERIPAMVKRVWTVIFVSVLATGSGLMPISAAQENKVTMGPGYEKGQQSQNTLSFATPQGWVRDEKAAKKVGLHTVLVPSGVTLENADKVITIAFQKKDASKPGLDNLKNFVRADLQDTLAQFPDAQFVKWQPSKLDPGKLNFWSIEMYGKKKNQPSPQRFVVLDAGDGYFSVSLTAKTRNDLQLPMYEDFFNSLGVEPSR
jgi:hypothetical protein